MNQGVQTYIEAVSDDRRPLFDKLQVLMLGQYLKAEVVWSYDRLENCHQTCHPTTARV